MGSVDYKFWANYIREIHQTLGKPNDIALELASGNCKLGSNLVNEFRKLYLSDFSLEMIKQNKTNIPSVCCDMLRLPFKNKFDFIFSAFDSINYLDTDQKLFDFFNAIHERLSSDGLFLFDVSSKQNSLKHLKELNRKGKYKGIEYSQKSEFDEIQSLHINKVELKLRNGEVHKEVHTQKIYDFYYYFEVLEFTGFFVLECFDAFTFDDGNAESDRIQFIVKRMN
jgi:SAM-dependent methyltransferase